MTETTTPETTTDEETAPDQPEVAEPNDVDHDERDVDPKFAKVRREARNLRDRLKATEDERDAALAKLDGADEQLARTLELRDNIARAEVERLARAAGLADGADLWHADGVEGPSMFLDDETHAVDTARVEAAVAEVLKARPHWSGGARLPYGQGPVEALESGTLSSGMGSSFGAASGKSWADVLGR